MIYEEVTQNWRNLMTVWLDYKKVFDSVPHSWITEALKLAGIPSIVIRNIEMLMRKWRTKMYMHGIYQAIETDVINYFEGILQRDTLSLILFILSVNPLSLQLPKQEGYQTGKDKRKNNISYFFFVDDLKLLASTIIKMMKLLETVTEFTNNVGTTLGESKCANQYIERGKRKEWGKINGLNIKEVQEGDIINISELKNLWGLMTHLTRKR